ncbi:uncharacterized protein [Miscanthus floridulus]|uniref:uncharacterized protein n=1 Tax=Miscanthus floridulus TaxID=154761 RepID=UPI003459B0D3
MGWHLGYLLRASQGGLAGIGVGDQTTISVPVIPDGDNLPTKSFPVGINSSPSPSPNGRIHRGESGIESPLPSLQRTDWKKINNNIDNDRMRTSIRPYTLSIRKTPHMWPVDSFHSPQRLHPALRPTPTRRLCHPSRCLHRPTLVVGPFFPSPPGQSSPSAPSSRPRLAKARREPLASAAVSFILARARRRPAPIAGMSPPPPPPACDGSSPQPGQHSPAVCPTTPPLASRRGRDGPTVLPSACPSPTLCYVVRRKKGEKHTL